MTEGELANVELPVLTLAQSSAGGTFCCMLLLGVLAVVVYFAAKAGTSAAIAEEKSRANQPAADFRESMDQIERALLDLIVSRERGSFVIVQRVLGKEFVQFVYTGEVGREVLVELPVPTGDPAMAMRAEAMFARLGGWIEGDKHQAPAGLNSERMAKMAWHILTEVYGLPADAKLGVTRG